VNKIVLAAVGLTIALSVTACGSGNTPSYPKVFGTTSALYQRSFKDGQSFGQTAGVPGSSVGEIQSNCGVLRLENMPSGDSASCWMAGCMFSGLLAAHSG
jgi:hypothetical protein